MTQEWHYSSNGQQHGPITGSELKQLAASGKLKPTDVIWKQGMANWISAGSTKGLFLPIAAAREPQLANDPPPLPPLSSHQAMNLADQLQKLQQLYQSSALGAEEFAKAKQTILNGPLAATAPLGNEQSSTPRSHLVPPADPLSQAPKAPKSTEASGPSAATQVPVLAHGPVAPKFAQLDAQERHLYSFTLQPMFYTRFWSSVWEMGKGYGWQPDYARFVVHFTDQRLLVESYDFSAKEKLASKGFYALAKFAVKQMAALAPTGAAYNAVMSEEGKLLKEMLNKPPDWFAIDYTEIVTAERQGFNNPIQNFAAKLFGRSMVKLVFRDPEREDLVFVTSAPTAGAVSFKDFNNEFIAVMGQLLKEKGRFQSEPGSKQPEKIEAAPKRRIAEEPGRNPLIITLGSVGFFLGIVLMCAGAFSSKGGLLALGMIVMFVGFFLWRPWGKDRKIASAWQGAKGTGKSSNKPPKGEGGS